MEAVILRARSILQRYLHLTKGAPSSTTERAAATDAGPGGPPPGETGMGGSVSAAPAPSAPTATTETTTTTEPDYWIAPTDNYIPWNVTYSNTTSSTINITDFQLTAINATDASQYGYYFCAKWSSAQQDLFQTANLCFAVAFLIPKSFKQSILLMRALAVTGFALLAAWGGAEVCAPDVLAWNVLLVLVNSIHTVFLIVRFLPPALSLELTELYLKLFKPLKVSKKHFQELAREGRVLRLEPGEAYSVEDITPADEKLSILLKGKLRVSCDQTHLHHIYPHQFVDSPEWEANREVSDDVFQVTIVAEESCTCLCWPRMRLERVLRHRPMLKVVLDSLIGKDITQKLYSLSEGATLTAAAAEAARAIPVSFGRSVSVDAVHEGARGRLRSMAWRTRQRYAPIPTHSPSRRADSFVASQFPRNSPFTTRAPLPAPRLPSQLVTQASSASLQPPPPLSHKRSLRKTASFRKPREVKFVEPEDTGPGGSHAGAAAGV